MNYHVIIATERRTAPRELAINVQGQLHSMGVRIDYEADANILYIAVWDGASEYLEVTKGNVADLKMAYAGWPMFTQPEDRDEKASLAVLDR